MVNDLILDIQRIDSKLYHDLLVTGGDTLIAVYITLKKNRNSVHSYQPHDGLKGYRMLKEYTNISQSVLRKNIPLLMELGLCRFLRNGGFFMLGNEKTKGKKKKLVPITVDKKFTKTKLNVINVRVDSYHKLQENIIPIKERQRETMIKFSNGEPLDHYERHTLKLLADRGILTVDDLNIAYNISLSNIKMSKLVGNGKVSKSTGQYYKNKLRENNLIQTRRHFQIIVPIQMPYQYYQDNRDALSKVYGHVTYRMGYICIEHANEFRCTSQGDEKYPSLPFLSKERVSAKDTYTHDRMERNCKGFPRLTAWLPKKENSMYNKGKDVIDGATVLSDNNKRI